MNGMVGYDAGSRGAAQQWPRWPGRDWVMEDDVTVRLVGDPRLDATAVQVSAGRGQVTLTGDVVSQGDWQRAEDTARSAAGVRDVRNNLRVRQPGATDAAG